MQHELVLHTKKLSKQQMNILDTHHHLIHSVENVHLKNYQKVLS